jgi:transposase-like protein
VPERSTRWLTTTGGQPCTDRKWDANTKAKIVLQGLQGKPVAELCHEYQMSQSLYDQWRDQFLAQAGQVVEVHQHGRKAAHLMQENARLKALVGELTLE